MRQLLPLAAMLILCFGCNSFEFSPEQTFDNNSPTNLNAAGLAKMKSNMPIDDTIRFVVTGDTQRSHDEVEIMIRKINSIPNTDFVIIAGDLSEFGVLQEMEWVAKEFNKLNAPYVAVIGNHDLVAKGSEVFKRMYGDLNYSFVYRGIKFVAHDTNGREYNFNGSIPDIGWLTKELQPQAGVTGFVTISHVPPNSLDFDKKLETPYQSLFARTPGFLASFHAHTHTYSEFGYDGSAVPFIVTATPANNEFLLAKIINNKLSYERIRL
ncbi:MAG: metallophosphoesterase [Bacteroidota bacterium]